MMTMRDTRLVAALLALAMVCLTILAAIGKVSVADAAKLVGGLLYGASVTWMRGAHAEADPAREESESP